MMKPNAKNLLNPFADAVNDIDADALLFFLNHLQQHLNASGGNFSSLFSKTIVYGMADVYSYICHEMGLCPRLDSLFDYFNVAPSFTAAAQADASDEVSMQQVVSTSLDQETIPMPNVYPDSFNLPIYPDGAPHASDAAGTNWDITPPPSPAPTLILIDQIGPRASVEIKLEVPADEEYSEFYPHADTPSDLPYANWNTWDAGAMGNHNASAQDIYFADAYYRHASHDDIDAAMHQVVAVGVEESGSPVDASDAASSSYYLVSSESYFSN